MNDQQAASVAGGAVLAGGLSRRMGVDKATVVIEGHTMLERCLEAMGRAGIRPLTVVGARSASVESSTTQHVEDEWPGEGPLGALITALDNLQTPIVVVMACDLIRPAHEEISRLCELLDGHDAIVPVADGRDQWLHAVWKRHCRRTLRDAFDLGTRSIHAAVADLDIRRVVVTDSRPYHDADTPSELPEGSQRWRT